MLQKIPEGTKEATFARNTLPLPREILLLVLRFLPKQDQKNVALVSRQFNEACFPLFSQQKNRSLQLKYHVEKWKKNTTAAARKWRLQDQSHIILENHQNHKAAIESYCALLNTNNNPKLAYFNQEKSHWFLIEANEDSIQTNFIGNIERLSKIYSEFLKGNDLINLSDSQIDRLKQKLEKHFGKNDHNARLFTDVSETPFFDFHWLSNHKGQSLTINIFAFPEKQVHESDYQKTYKTFHSEGRESFRKVVSMGPKSLTFDLRYYIGTFSLDKNNKIVSYQLNQDVFEHLYKTIESRPELVQKIQEHLPDLMKHLGVRPPEDNCAKTITNSQVS